MPQNKELFIKLHNEGKTYQEIGDQFKISRQRVHQIVTGYHLINNPLSGSATREDFDFRPDIDHVKLFKLPRIKKVVELDYFDYSGCPIPTKMEGIDRIRELVRLRDNHICQKCFRQWLIGERRFDVHHLDEAMESVKNYAYDKENQDKMVTYCHKCHLSLHTVRTKMSKSNTGTPANPILTLSRLLETKWFLKMNFNQKEIAKILGITPQSINRYANILRLKQAK